MAPAEQAQTQEDPVRAMLDTPGAERAIQSASRLMEGAERLADQIAPPSERDLMRRALDLSARKKLLLARRLWKDERVRTRARIPMFVGTIYAFLPISVIPLRFAFLRQWEKLIGLGLVLWLIIRITPEEVLREHLEAVEKPGLVRRILRRGERDE
jgi:hypothetical protein